MKVYKEQNVYDMALERMRWVFDEFPNVVVSYSGGKDSTVIFELAMKVAKEKNRLPLAVLWIDQEAEWTATVEQVKHVMYNPDVKPYWLQGEFKMENSSSTIDTWRNLWGEGEEWIRDKDPIAIHDNRYYPKTAEFYDIFKHFTKKEFGGKKTAYVAGVRTEESPGRYMGLTAQAVYKYVTWGKVLSHKEEHYTFYPIYDWSYIDVWKSIHDNGWRYCKLYDMMYQKGVPINNMRVSNLHHAHALSALYNLQEIEPENYERIVKRMSGIDTVAKLGKDDFYVKDLPFMFKDWVEYRDYLLENLIVDEEARKIFRKKFDQFDEKFMGTEAEESLLREEVNAILANDIYFVKLTLWATKGVAYKVAKKRKGQIWLQ